MFLQKIGSKSMADEKSLKRFDNFDNLEDAKPMNGSGNQCKK
jgi:hypothetical protein